jgi:hypothetical protein
MITRVALPANYLLTNLFLTSFLLAMVFPIPHSAAGTYTRLAYTQATPTHLLHLLDGIRSNLERYFPHLLPVHWITSLARVSPQLWLAPGVVTMSWDDFMRVTKVAAALPGPWAGDAAGYCPQALYLARYVAEHTSLAHLALAEVEAAPSSTAHMPTSLLPSSRRVIAWRRKSST